MNKPFNYEWCSCHVHDPASGRPVRRSSQICGSIDLTASREHNICCGRAKSCHQLVHGTIQYYDDDQQLVSVQRRRFMRHYPVPVMKLIASTLCNLKHGTQDRVTFKTTFEPTTVIQQSFGNESGTGSYERRLPGKQVDTLRPRRRIWQ